tara:strand:- start:372 stop:875 length:504 start_codon:yes stop_codon:yes gene_type:complete
MERLGEKQGVCKMINKFIKNIEFNSAIFISYLRLVIGGIFIYASLDKIADPYAFSKAISAYEFSSLIGLSSLDNILALTLPWLELILGVFLILGFYTDESINFIIILMLFFIVMLSQAYLRGLKLEDCGCGLNDSTIAMDILRDLVLLFMCLLIKFRKLFIGKLYAR